MFGLFLKLSPFPLPLFDFRVQLPLHTGQLTVQCAATPALYIELALVAGIRAIEIARITAVSADQLRGLNPLVAAIVCRVRELARLEVLADGRATLAGDAMDVCDGVLGVGHW